MERRPLTKRQANAKPPKGFVPWLKKKIEAHYLFYRGSEIVLCTACEVDSGDVGKQKHNEKGICPVCCASVVFKNAKLFRGKRHVIDQAYEVVCGRVAIGVGSDFIMKSYRLHRFVVSEEFKVHYRLQSRWMAINDCKGYRQVYKNISWVCEETSWKPRRGYNYSDEEHLGGFFKYYSRCIDIFDYSRNLNSLAKNKMPYAAAGKDLDYYRCWVPIVEVLEKTGMNRLAGDVLDYNQGLHLNFRGKTLEKFLRIPKGTFKVVRAIDPNHKDLIVLRKAVKIGIDLQSLYPEKLRKIVDSSMFTFKDTQSDIERYGADFKKAVLKGYSRSLYLDYLRMATENGYDLTRKSVMYPKNLKAAHDEIMTRVRLEKVAKNNKAIRKVAETYAKYAYEYGDYLIRPIASAEELVREGNSLSHCVGGYADRIADRATTIFVIRLKTHPDTPFYTVEYKDGIRQCRGYRNQSATDEVKEFTENWLKHIKKQNRKPAKTRVAAKTA